MSANHGYSEISTGSVYALRSGANARLELFSIGVPPNQRVPWGAA